MHAYVRWTQEPEPVSESSAPKQDMLMHVGIDVRTMSCHSMHQTSLSIRPLPGARQRTLELSHLASYPRHPSQDTTQPRRKTSSSTLSTVLHSETSAMGRARSDCERQLQQCDRAGTCPPLSSLNHVSFLCADVERTKRFYRDLLGFIEVKRPDSFKFEGSWCADGSASSCLLYFASVQPACPRFLFHYCGASAVSS